MTNVVIVQWICQTSKRPGPRLTSVVPGLGQSIRTSATCWRREVSLRCISHLHSSQACNPRCRRRPAHHKWISPNHTPGHCCSRWLRWWRHLYGARSLCICPPVKNILPHMNCYSAACSCCKCPQCQCTYNTSKQKLIKKERKKESKKKLTILYVPNNWWKSLHIIGNPTDNLVLLLTAIKYNKTSIS